MKIVRYFAMHECQDTGNVGWIPMWIPRSANFNPTTASGIVHDMLEHRLCDTGYPHEEIMAFGRIVALRGLPGVFRIGGSRTFSPEESLGQELHSIWERCEEIDGVRIASLPETARGSRPVSECAERMIQKIVKAFSDALERETEYRTKHKDDWIDVPQENLAHTICTWLRAGYLDAVRRYGGTSNCEDIGYAMHEWSTQNTKRFDFDAGGKVVELEKSVLRMSFDTVDFTFSDRVIFPSERDGTFPAWLYKRLSWWENS